MTCKVILLHSDLTVTSLNLGTRETPAQIRGGFISQIPWPDARVIQAEQERGHRQAFWQRGEVGSSHYIIFNYYLLTSLTRTLHITD